MYLLYVDESGDPGPNGSDYLVLSGAALFEGKWSQLDTDLRGLINYYFPNDPKPTEIHLVELRRGKGAFRRLTPAQRDSLLRDYCRLVAHLLPTELRLFAIIAEKRDWFAQNPGKSGDDLYVAMFEELSSRFDLYLRRRFAENAPSKGVIIVDPHKPALVSALKSHQRNAQHVGNRWSRLYNLIETLFFLPSHESPGLQVADLCSYAVWRLVTADEDTVIRRIRNMFDREPLTSIRYPGKWHGVRFLGTDQGMRRRIRRVWPLP